MNQVYTGTGPIVDVTTFDSTGGTPWSGYFTNTYLRFHFANGSQKSFLVESKSRDSGGGGGNYA